MHISVTLSILKYQWFGLPLFKKQSPRNSKCSVYIIRLLVPFPELKSIPGFKLIRLHLYNSNTHKLYTMKGPELGIKLKGLV